MNIDQLNDAANIHIVSIASWATAIIIPVGFLVWKYLTRKAVKSPSWSFFSVVSMFAALFGVNGSIVQGYSADLARDDSFHEELKSQYGVETSSSLIDVENAARRSKIIAVTLGNEVLEVRPHVDGRVLTLFKVSDGKAIDKITG